MRCVSCNRQLDNGDLYAKKLDGSPEDMCIYCRHRSREVYRFTGERQGTFPQISDLFDDLSELLKANNGYYDGNYYE